MGHVASARGTGGRAWARALALVCGLTTVGSCSYASVRTTGDVALTLPEHVGVLEDAAAYCRLGASTSGDTALDACDRAKCPPLAPSAGLYLVQVDY